MNILAFFTNNGTPALGLNPIIRIRDVVTNALLITDASMSEVGDGHYKYDFLTYDKDNDYSIRCDGGILLPTSERYTYAGNENYIEDIGSTISESVSAISVSGGSIDYDLVADAVWDESTKSHTASASFGEMVNDISLDLKRLLGLTHENIFIDQPAYDSHGNMISARLRIYSDPASVGTASDVIGTYEISAPSTAPGKFTTWKQVRTS